MTSGVFHITCRTIHDDILIDTRKSGFPVKQDLDEAIEGFSIDVKDMKLKERRLIYIHPELAYRDTGWIQPNLALIIDIEHISLPTILK